MINFFYQIQSEFLRDHQEILYPLAAFLNGSNFLPNVIFGAVDVRVLLEASPLSIELYSQKSLKPDQFCQELWRKAFFQDFFVEQETKDYLLKQVQYHYLQRNFWYYLSDPSIEKKPGDF